MNKQDEQTMLDVWELSIVSPKLPQLDSVTAAPVTWSCLPRRIERR